MASSLPALLDDIATILDAAPWLMKTRTVVLAVVTLAGRLRGRRGAA